MVVLVVPGVVGPYAWRAIVGFFSLIVHHDMEPKVRVFFSFFQMKANPRSPRWWYAFPCKGFSFPSSP